jgi:hypothetical protein
MANAFNHRMHLFGTNGVNVRRPNLLRQKNAESDLVRYEAAGWTPSR